MPAAKPRGSSGQMNDQVNRVLADAEGTAGVPDEPATPDIPPDRTRMFKTLSFSRMKLSWTSDELPVMQFMVSEADRVLRGSFPEIYRFLDEELYPAVREPVLLGQENGLQWQRDEDGRYIERWDRLTDAVIRQLLYVVSTHLIGWRQQAATMWGSAMFAKGMWEEVFARGYTGPENKRLTIDDRTQMGRLASMDERYMAIFQSLLSRRADALVRSMERIEEMLLKALRS